MRVGRNGRGAGRRDAGGGPGGAAPTAEGDPFQLGLDVGKKCLRATCAIAGRWAR